MGADTAHTGRTGNQDHGRWPAATFAGDGYARTDEQDKQDQVDAQRSNYYQTNSDPQEQRTQEHDGS